MTTKRNKTVLGKKQLKAAEMLSNPDFSGTITQLCECIGVARSTFYRWLEDETFRDYVDGLIDRYTDSELSRVWKALMRRIDAGDIQAIKLYFELKGKYKQGIGRDAEEKPDNGLLKAIEQGAKGVWEDVQDVQPQADAGNDLVGPPDD